MALKVRPCIVLLFGLCCLQMLPVSGRSTGTGQVTSPVIFIPGKGGCQLEAKIDRSPDQKVHAHCPHQQPWQRIWLDIWQFLWPGQIECWAENVMLHYNRTTKTSSPPPGVEFRVPGFGDTTTVEYVDDSWTAYMFGNIGSYLVTLTTEMELWGYTRGVDIRAAPYDFRFAPHSQGDYYERLRALVEDTYRQNDRKKVTLLAHSMGGIHALYFLHTVPQWWKNKYIRMFVPVNSPWKGTVLISNLYTSGYNWGIAPLEKEVVRTQQRSWETGALLLPQADAWGPNDILVKTPTRNYTAHDYDDYFNDVNYPLGKEMYDNIRHSSYDMGHPGVDTYCVYSYGLETPDHLVYDEGEFPNGHPTMMMGEGDGTVNLKSLDYCKYWAVRHNQDHVAAVKTYEYIPHIDLLFHPDFTSFFKELLEQED